MVIFTFSALDRKDLFWANLVHKIKIVSFSWNFVPRLIRIRRIQWCFSLFPFSTCKFCPKNTFGILMLPNQSPSSLLPETWSQRLFLFIVNFRQIAHLFVVFVFLVTLTMYLLAGTEIGFSAVLYVRYSTPLWHLVVQKQQWKGQAE